jgi:hypothetical protein
MVRRFTFVVVAVAGMGFAALPAYTQAQPGLSKTLRKCESGTASALSKFTGAKTKCITKCVTAARKTSGPFAGCFAPYTDPSTLTCITGSLKGAETKGGAAIAKVCAAADACPMCYVNLVGGGAGCTDASGANPWVQGLEGFVDHFTTLLYCEESGIVAPPATPSKSEAKCEDGVVKAVAKAWSAETKCFQKCNANLARGKISGSCDPFTLNDPTTIACVFDPTKGVLPKTAAAVDKACFIPPATAPLCFLINAGTTGVAIANYVVRVADIFISDSNCGSPSGAFLD